MRKATSNGQAKTNDDLLTPSNSVDEVWKDQGLQGSHPKTKNKRGHINGVQMGGEGGKRKGMDS